MDTPRPSIFLATPCYGGLANIAYVNSLLALQRVCSARDIGLEIMLGGGDALIPRARGIMAGRFLNHTQHTHLLFVDADIAFRPEAVLRLLEADKDVVGGVYPSKHIHWDRARRAIANGHRDVPAASLGYVVRFLPNQEVELSADGFAKVAYVGTGFMLIRRAVLQRLAERHPELCAKHGDMSGSPVRDAPMVFETFIEAETGEYLSEDYAFCRRWQDLGGDIFADFNTRLTHVGPMAFEGSVADATAR